MPDGYRTVINMFLIEGFSHNEIAEYLGISPATSRSQLLRGKKWLQKRLTIQNEKSPFVTKLINSL